MEVFVVIAVGHYEDKYIEAIFKNMVSAETYIKNSIIKDKTIIYKIETHKVD